MTWITVSHGLSTASPLTTDAPLLQTSTWRPRGYGTGISAVGEIADLASEAGLIEKSGAYYSIGGERIAQGRDKACQYLGEHPAPADELREKLVALRKAENARLGAPAPAATGESEAT